MKLVKEHLNEKFSEESDPIHDMGIGELNQIQKELDHVVTGKNLKLMSANEQLVLGIQYGISRLSNYAIKNGADQLWWQYGGPFGGYHGLTTNLVQELVKIVKVSGSKVSFTDVVVYSHTKDKFITPNNTYISTSGIFTSKFKPVDQSFIRDIKHLNSKSSELLKTIQKLQK